jgi:hypothetical protein
MGWCHEFGAQIETGCDHPMVAGEAACHCDQCGVICEGKFAGCEAVWAAGPREVEFDRPPRVPERPATTAVMSEDARHDLEEEVPPDAPWARPESDPRSVQPPDPLEPIRRPTVYADAPLASPVTDDARLEVMEWLRSAFDGLRAELRVLSDGIARQQSSIADVIEANAAAVQIVEAADALPGRVAAAVAEAVAGVTPEPSPEAQAALEGVTEAIVQLEYLADDLRNESIRLHAFREALSADLPAVAKAVEDAAARADARLAELTDKMDELAVRKGFGGLVRGLGSGH